MTKHKTRNIILIGTGLTIIIFLFGLLTSYFWVLLSPNPLRATPSKWLPWPIACSTRGCVTTWQWQSYNDINKRFSEKANLPEVSPAETLTQLIYRHIVSYAQVRPNISIEDAQRYRREVLNLVDDSRIQEMFGINTETYDQNIIMPFLELESLRQQFNAETVEETLKQLTEARKVFVLPLKLKWNQSELKVIDT